VIGMSSSENGARSLREKGAEGEVVNALDENAVLALVRRVKPNAVIEELTSLPKRYTPEEMRAAADRDRNVRLVGGRNVHNARPARSVTSCSLLDFSTAPAKASRRRRMRWR